MNNEKLSLKEQFKIYKKILTLISKAAPFTTLIQILTEIFNVIIPLIAIFMSEKIINAIHNNEEEKTVLFLAFLTVLFEFFAFVLSGIFNYFYNKNRTIILNHLDTILQNKTHSLHYEVLESSTVTNLRKNIESNAESNIGNIFETMWFTSIFFRNIISSIATLFILKSFLLKLSLSSNLFLIILVVVTVFIFAFHYKYVNNTIINWFKTKKLYEAQYDFYSVKYLDDTWAAKDVRVLQQQNFIENELLNKNYLPFYERRKKIITSEASNKILVVALTAFIGSVVAVFIGILAKKDIITVGEVVKYYSSITLAITSFSQTVIAVSGILHTCYFLKPLFDYLNLKVENQNQNFNNNFDFESVTLENILYKYNSSNQFALENINLKIKRYEKIAIVGKNGSGKTTLAKLLCGLINAQSGKIIMNNKKLDIIEEPSMFTNNISAVFQDFKLFPFSVGTNISTCKNFDEHRVWKVLDDVGLKEKVQNLPNQLDEVLFSDIDEKGVEFSGGELQRLALARALYKDAEVLILDEPTSSVDVKTEIELYENFYRLTNNKTVVFISHRLASCKFCDKIFVMDNGKIIESGTHDELLKENGMYTKLWSTQLTLNCET